MEKKLCNSIRIRLNDVVTVWDIITLNKLCKSEGYGVIFDVSEGGCSDTFALECAMGIRCNMITTGGIDGGINILYGNEIIRKEELYVEKALYAGDKIKGNV